MIIFAIIFSNKTCKLWNIIAMEKASALSAVAS